jgi:hypothetical protein
MLKKLVYHGFALLLPLLHGVKCQSSNSVLSVSSTSVPTTTRDSLSSDTTSVSLASPTGTGEPCAQIARAVENGSTAVRISVPAQLAYNCLTSVPVKPKAALGTVDIIKKMVQFQSNLAFLRNPPQDYDNAPTDILAGLDKIKTKVTNNDYRNHYDFEADIAVLLNSAKDGHLGFDGPTYAGAVRWRRDVDCILISTSFDGGLAKVYNLGKADFLFLFWVS